MKVFVVAEGNLLLLWEGKMATNELGLKLLISNPDEKVILNDSAC